MARTVTIEIELSKDWKLFRLPPALRERLQELLDRQDQTRKLSAKERRKAKALAELADMLSFM